MMRPTVTEELIGIATILRRQVRPAVEEPLVASQLATIADELERLATTWGEVVARLTDEIIALETLLAGLADRLAGGGARLGELAARVRALFDERLDGHERRFDPLHARYCALRGLLAEIVEELHVEGMTRGQLGGADESIRLFLLARLAEDDSGKACTGGD